MLSGDALSALPFSTAPTDLAPPPAGAGGVTLRATPAISAEDYAAALLSLLPTGPAWPRDDDATIPAVARGLSDRAAAIHQRAADLLAEVWPGTTVELLAEWEASLGLPDPCVGPGQSTTQRRAAVMARLTAVGGQSIPYLVSVAAALGYAITIEEHQPAAAGILRAGAPLGGEDWAHAITVHAPEATIVPAVAGRMVAGDPLRAWGNEALQCVLSRLRPAHSVIRFSYGS